MRYRAIPTPCQGTSGDLRAFHCRRNWSPSHRASPNPIRAPPNAAPAPRGRHRVRHDSSRASHLASDADEEKAFEIERFHRRQDVQIRRECRFDASGFENVVFREGDDGRGAKRSLSSLWTQTTASTVLLRSISSATCVTIPVHWAPHRWPVLGVKNLSVDAETQFVLVLDIAAHHTSVPSNNTARNTDRCRPCTATSRSSTRDIPTAFSSGRGVVDWIRAFAEEGTGLLHFRDVVRVT